jgi:hypothetical protein
LKFSSSSHQYQHNTYPSSNQTNNIPAIIQASTPSSLALVIHTVKMAKDTSENKMTEVTPDTAPENKTTPVIARAATPENALGMRGDAPIFCPQERRISVKAHIIWDRIERLKPWQLQLCDDLLGRLADVNRVDFDEESLRASIQQSGMQPLDAYRKWLWVAVFDGWNNELPINHPGPIQELSSTYPYHHRVRVGNIRDPPTKHLPAPTKWQGDTGSETATETARDTTTDVAKGSANQFASDAPGYTAQGTDYNTANPAAAHDPPDGDTGESATGTPSSANDDRGNGTTKDNTNRTGNDSTSDTVPGPSGGTALLPIAFVYCHPNFDTGKAKFPLADHRGCTLHLSQVRVSGRLTLEQARGAAISRRDFREAKRVGIHNLRLVIYWARRRLVADIKRFLAASDTGTVSYFPPEDPEQPAEDLGELVQFRPALPLMLKAFRSPFFLSKHPGKRGYMKSLYREAMTRVWVDRIPVWNHYDVVEEVSLNTA